MTKILLASIFVATAAVASADVAYNSIVGGRTSGFGVYGPDALWGTPLYQGWRFTSLATGDTSEITANIDPYSGSGDVLVSILSDNGGQRGDYLGTWQFAGNYEGEWVTFDAVGVHLDAGTSYWFEVQATDNLSLDVAGYEAPGEWNYAQFMGTNYNFYSPAAYRIDLATEAVPEPTSLAVLGLGGLAMLRRRRRS